MRQDNYDDSGFFFILLAVQKQESVVLFLHDMVAFSGFIPFLLFETFELCCIIYISAENGKICSVQRYTCTTLPCKRAYNTQSDSRRVCSEDDHSDEKPLFLFPKAEKL